MIAGNINVDDSPQDWGACTIRLFIGATSRYSLVPPRMGLAESTISGLDGLTKYASRTNREATTGERPTSNNLADGDHLFLFVGPEQPSFTGRWRVYMIT
jgi:hypothetical protein